MVFVGVFCGYVLDGFAREVLLVSYWIYGARLVRCEPLLFLRLLPLVGIGGFSV